MKKSVLFVLSWPPSEAAIQKCEHFHSQAGWPEPVLGLDPGIKPGQDKKRRNQFFHTLINGVPSLLFPKKEMKNKFTLPSKASPQPGVLEYGLISNPFSVDINPIVLELRHSLLHELSPRRFPRNWVRAGIGNSTFRAHT